jgi:hypothetical protein
MRSRQAASPLAQEKPKLQSNHSQAEEACMISVPEYPKQAYDEHGCVRFVINGKVMPWAPESIRQRFETPIPYGESPKKAKAPVGVLPQAPKASKPKVDQSIAQAALLYSEGRSVRAIASVLHCSDWLVYFKLRKAGVELRGSEAPKKIELADVKMLHARGMTVKEIAEHLHCSIGPIYRRLHEGRVILRMPAPIGETFGNLTVMSEHPELTIRQERQMVCNCACGAIAVLAPLKSLRARKRTSCGCLRLQFGQGAKRRGFQR